MKICRIRNFKKSFEVTVSFTAQEAEYLSHAIGNLNAWSTPERTKSLGYASHHAKGERLLSVLNDKAFWTHWDSNFRDREFYPEGKFSERLEPKTA